MTDRYIVIAEDRSSVICRDCSTRSTVVRIPADELGAHNDWHACPEPDADHSDEDGAALRCPFCGKATHYSERVGDYRHCDGSACWQTAADDDVVHYAASMAAPLTACQRLIVNGQPKRTTDRDAVTCGPCGGRA